MDTRIGTACGCAFVLALSCLSPTWANGPDAGTEPPADVMAHAGPSPWLQPIDETRPIRRMSVLKTEYRRIRALRRAQMQPEYERRMAASGRDAAEAWREDTLRKVARRDLRDLRARLER